MKKITKICLPIAAAAMVGGSLVPLVSCGTNTGQYDNVKVNYNKKAVKIVSLDKVFGEDLVLKYELISKDYTFERPSVKIDGSEAEFAWDEDLKTVAIDRDLLPTQETSVEINLVSNGKYYSDTATITVSDDSQAGRCVFQSVRGQFGEDMVVSVRIKDDGYMTKGATILVDRTRISIDLPDGGTTIVIPADKITHSSVNVDIVVTLVAREITLAKCGECQNLFECTARQNTWGKDVVASFHTLPGYEYDSEGNYHVYVGENEGSWVEITKMLPEQEKWNEITIPWDVLTSVQMTYKDTIWFDIPIIGVPHEYTVNKGKPTQGLTYEVTNNHWKQNFVMDYAILPGYDCRNIRAFVLEEGSEWQEVKPTVDKTFLVVDAAYLGETSPSKIDIEFEIVAKEIPVEVSNAKCFEEIEVESEWGQDVWVRTKPLDNKYELIQGQDIVAQIQDKQGHYATKTVSIDAEYWVRIPVSSFAGFDPDTTSVLLNVPVQGQIMANVNTPKADGIEVIDWQQPRYGEDIVVNYKLNPSYDLGTITAMADDQYPLAVDLTTEGKARIAFESIQNYDCTVKIEFDFPTTPLAYTNITVQEYAGLETDYAKDIKFGQDIEITFDVKDNYEIDYSKGGPYVTINGTKGKFSIEGNKFIVDHGSIDKYDDEIYIDIPVVGSAIQTINVNVDGDEGSATFDPVQKFIYGQDIEVTNVQINPNYKLEQVTYQIGDHMPKPTYITADDKIVIDHSEITDINEPVLITIPTVGRELMLNYDQTGITATPTQTPIFGKDIVINYSVNFGYKKELDATVTWGDTPLRISDNQTSPTEGVLTIYTSEIATWDEVYANPINIDWHVNAHSYNVTVNGSADPDFTPGLHPSVVDHDYGSNVTATYTIDEDYEIPSDKQIIVHYGEGTVPFEDVSGTITIDKDNIPDYRKPIDINIPVVGKLLNISVVDTDLEAVTVDLPEARFGEDISIPYHVDTGRYGHTEGEIAVTIGGGEYTATDTYDSSTGDGTISIPKEAIEHVVDITVSIQTTVDEISVSFTDGQDVGVTVDTEGMIHDRKNGVQFTYSYNEGFKADPNKTITVKINGGAPFTPAHTADTITIPASQFGTEPNASVEIDIPFVGQALTITVEEQTGLHSEIIAGAYNEDVQVEYWFDKNYHLVDDDTTNVKYQINDGEWTEATVTPGDHSIITIAKEEITEYTDTIQIQIPTVGKQLTGLDCPLTDGFTDISYESDTFGEDVVIGYKLNDNYVLGDDESIEAVVRGGLHVNPISVDRENHKVTFEWDSLDIHDYFDEMIVTLVAVPQAYSGIDLVYDADQVEASVEGEPTYGSDIVVNFSYKTGYKPSADAITYKIDENPALPATVDETAGTITIPWDDISSVVTYDSDIIINIPADGETFGNVHFNTTDYAGIAEGAITAIYGQDFTAAFTLGTSYVHTDELSYTIGEEASAQTFNDGISVENNIVTIAWDALAAHLAGIEDPTSQSITINYGTEGKDLTNLEIYGSGLDITPFEKKYGSDITINFTLAGGFAVDPDDITLKVQSQPVETGEATWGASETEGVYTIVLHKEFFGPEAGKIQSWQSHIEITVPSSQVTVATHWADGDQIVGDAPSIIWGQDLTVNYVVKDNYERTDAAPTVKIDENEAIPLTESTPGEFTIPWAAIEDEITADSTVIIHLETKTAKYTDHTATATVAGEAKPALIKNQEWSGVYGGDVNVVIEIDENYVLDYDAAGTITDAITASFNSAAIDAGKLTVTSEDATHINVKIDKSAFTGTGKIVDKPIVVNVALKEAEYNGTINATGTGVTGATKVGNPAWNEAIEIAITLEAGYDFDTVTAKIGTDTTAITLTQSEDDDSHWILPAGSLTSATDTINLTVTTVSSGLNVNTDGVNENITLVQPFTKASYLEGLEFEFDITDGYDLGDVAIGDAAGEKDKTATPVAGTDHDYVVTFAASDVQALLGDNPSATLYLTIEASEPTPVVYYTGIDLQENEKVTWDSDVTQIEFGQNIVINYTWNKEVYTKDALQVQITKSDGSAELYSAGMSGITDNYNDEDGTGTITIPYSESIIDASTNSIYIIFIGESK